MNDQLKDNINSSSLKSSTIIVINNDEQNVEITNRKNQLLNQLIDLINNNDYLNITFKLNFISNFDDLSLNNGETNIFSTKLPCHLIDNLFKPNEKNSDYFIIIRRLTNLYKDYFIELLQDFKSIYIYFLYFFIND